MDSDDESGSSHESDYDPLTTMCVFTQQDRPIFPTPGPQDVCTIIIPPTASTSPTVSKSTSKKKGKKRKPRGQKPGPRKLKKKKQPVTEFFGMAAMCGGDDTFIAPKTFQVFDNILEQSKVWSKSIIFQEGLPSQFNKSETYIDLSSHLSNSYADPY